MGEITLTLAFSSVTLPFLSNLNLFQRRRVRSRFLTSFLFAIRYSNGQGDNRQVNDIDSLFPNGLFIFGEADCVSDLDSNPIPVLGTWDGNLNLTPYSVNSFACYNVTIWFVVRIGIRIRIRQCK